MQSSSLRLTSSTACAVQSPTGMVQPPLPIGFEPGWHKDALSRSRVCKAKGQNKKSVSCAGQHGFNKGDKHLTKLTWQMGNVKTGFRQADKAFGFILFLQAPVMDHSAPGDTQQARCSLFKSKATGPTHCTPCARSWLSLLIQHDLAPL